MNGLFLSPIEVNLRHLYDTKMSVGIIKMNPIPKNINPYCDKSNAGAVTNAGAVIAAIVIPI